MKKLFLLIFIATFANSIKSAQTCEQKILDEIPGLSEALQHLTVNQQILLGTYLAYEKINSYYDAQIEKVKKETPILAAKLYVEKHTKAYIPYKNDLTMIRQLESENENFKKAMSLITSAIKDKKNIESIYNQISCRLIEKLGKQAVDVLQIAGALPKFESSPAA